MNKYVFISIWIIVGVFILATFASGYLLMNQQKISLIANFEECTTAGYPIMESYPEQCRTPDGRMFVRIISSPEVSFGIPFTLQLGSQVSFDDSLNVTLVEVNDSRCKEGVVCIWAGELSPFLYVKDGTIGVAEEIRLGTTAKTSTAQGGYVFSLNDATETTATITITKESKTVACTKEAKLCPDGSTVGHTGPNCEFAQCPTGY